MGSVLPSSFSWGFNPKIESNDQSTNEKNVKSEEQEHQTIINSELLSSSQSSLTSRSKRRHQDEDQNEDQNEDGNENRNENQDYSYSISSRKSSIKKVDKFRVIKKELSYKKSRIVQRIIGQPLSTQRIVEVLDKKNLQQLLNNLISIHPELTQDVYHCAPKPTVFGAIEILSTKVHSVISSLPYKVDPTSEYSYLRVKPIIEDFLSALSDYTLHFLPPVEVQASNSLEFLDKATALLHKLPTFAKLSNNYFKDLAYEQLSHTWCICLKEFIRNSSTTSSTNALLILINNNWEIKLKKHDELSIGKASSVVEFFKDEVNWFRDEFELETTDKFTNLKNFSPTNSPLHGLKNNILEGRDFS